MSAARAVKYVPERAGEHDENSNPAYCIGAHADYRPHDFTFPRMQSRTMQETPWAARTGRMRSWSELIGIGLLLGLLSIVALLGTTALV